MRRVPLDIAKPDELADCIEAVEYGEGDVRFLLGRAALALVVDVLRRGEMFECAELAHALAKAMSVAERREYHASR